MSAGKAHGEDRIYQENCLKILQTVDGMSSLVPHSGDGIDVEFPIGGTGVTFDIALKDAFDRLVVAECKRWESSVKQGALFTFAREVELLRKESGCEVSGVFFAKKGYQIGAVRHGAWSGIDLIVLSENQTVSNFTLTFLRYDKKRDKRVQEAVANMSGETTPRGEVDFKINPLS